MIQIRSKPAVVVLAMVLGTAGVTAAPDEFAGLGGGTANRSFSLHGGADNSDRGEFVLSLFTGLSLAENNDLRLRQAGGTDLTFHNVSYQGKDFSSPPYYGARLTYYLPGQSHWGFGLEYFHAKLYLGTGDIVHVTGTRGGVAVNDNEPVGGTIQTLILHNGFNFVTADVFYRWQLGRRGEDFLGRFQPYVGAGVGTVVPYVESQLVGGTYRQGYQIRGPGVLGIAGLNFDLTKHVSLFTEYKFAYAHLDELHLANGSISIDPMTHNFITGVSFRF
jgi:lipid A oxidase